MDSSLQHKITQIIEHCKAIQILLETDQTHFAENNFMPLAESNQQKSLELDKLSTAVSELQIYLPQHNQSLKSLATHPAYSDMIETLKSELNKCYQSLAINNHIVFANLQQLKGIWDTLLSSKKEADCMYDHTGSLNK